MCLFGTSRSGLIGERFHRVCVSVSTSVLWLASPQSATAGFLKVQTLFILKFQTWLAHLARDRFEGVAGPACGQRNPGPGLECGRP